MIVPILIFGEKKLREAWWLPHSFRKAGFAVSDFREYVTELINEERELIAQRKQNSPSKHCPCYRYKMTHPTNCATPIRSS